MRKTNPTDTLCQYLERLTKDELIRLIVKFAPQSFRDNIESQFASQEEALTIFKKASKAIGNILSDEELLYDPSGFERKLVQQLEKLRGLWEKLPAQIGELIITMIEEVEQAFEDGYLYLEKYGEEDEYFESEEVNAYVFQFVKTLSKDIQGEYVEQLKEVLANTGYSTFLSVERQLSKF